MSDGTIGSYAWDANAGTWSLSLNQTSTDTYAEASLVSIFNVSEPLILTVTWDFTQFDNAPLFTEAAWFLFESDDASFTFDELIEAADADTTGFGTPSDGILAGTASIVLDPSKTYQLALDLFGTDGGNFPSVGFINAQLSPIPAPGALALLGVVGLAAARRRR